MTKEETYEIIKSLPDTCSTYTRYDVRGRVILRLERDISGEWSETSYVEPVSTPGNTKKKKYKPVKSMTIDELIYYCSEIQEELTKLYEEKEK